MRFKEDLILQPDTVVHCGTEEKANALLKWADSIGRSWCNGRSYLGCNKWYDYNETTCYNILEGGLGSKASYLNFRYNILEFEDVVEGKVTATTYENNIIGHVTDGETKIPLKEVKMKGRETKVELQLVEIRNGELVERVVYEPSIQEYVEAERTVIAGGNTYTNVQWLMIDDNVVFTGAYPTLRVRDDRRKVAKLKGKIEETALLNYFGVITSEDKNIEIAKLNKKLSGLSSEIKYELVW